MKMHNFIFILFFVVASYFFIGRAPIPDNIIWGVNFSQKHSKDLGLDWKENYSALVEDLGVKNIKLAAHWDLLEPEENQFSFQDLDWQVQKAEENKANLLMVIGMKTPRWPECHIPEWAKGKTKPEQQSAILEMLRTVVSRYKNSSAIMYWQIENEPFFPFGDCPWVDKGFLKQEIDLIKSIDTKPIIVSDSGEGSFWIQAGEFGDVVGTTMYKKVWFRQLKAYINYPFPGIFYWRKAQIIRSLFGKEVICVELQAEPWGPALLYYSPLEEQSKTMNLEQFKTNIAFAKTTGLKEFYLWGSEWWYWMKEKQGQPEIWNEAKKLF